MSTGSLCLLNGIGMKLCYEKGFLQSKGAMMTVDTIANFKSEKCYNWGHVMFSPRSEFYVLQLAQLKQHIAAWGCQGSFKHLCCFWSFLYLLCWRRCVFVLCNSTCAFVHLSISCNKLVSSSLYRSDVQDFSSSGT